MTRLGMAKNKITADSIARSSIMPYKSFNEYTASSTPTRRYSPPLTKRPILRSVPAHTPSRQHMPTTTIFSPVSASKIPPAAPAMAPVDAPYRYPINKIMKYESVPEMEKIISACLGSPYSAVTARIRRLINSSLLNN